MPDCGSELMDKNKRRNGKDNCQERMKIHFIRERERERERERRNNAEHVNRQTRQKFKSREKRKEKLNI